MKTPREVVHDWVAAYNPGYSCGGGVVYHEDATNLQVALGSPTIGRKAMLEDLLSFFHAYPDNFTRIQNLCEYRECAFLKSFGGGT